MEFAPSDRVAELLERITGFTEEHVLHRFIARATVLDVLYGSARALRAELGRALLERGTMPRPGQP